MMTDSRMSMSYGSARPSFGLVPSAATTGSDMLNFSDLKQEMAAFTARFDAWIAKKRDAIDSGKVQHRRRLTELDENRQTAEKQMIMAESECQRLLQRIDKEYEQVKQARGSIEQTQLHLESVQTMHQNLATEAQEWRTNLSQLQAERQKRLKQRQDRWAKDEPEVKFFEEALGLRIEGVRNAILRFVFTCLTEQDPDREFSFILQISDTGEECVPMLPKMNFLINDLNQSRNFYAFLKQARLKPLSEKMKQPSIATFFKQKPSEGVNNSTGNPAMEEKKRKLVVSDSSEDEERPAKMPKENSSTSSNEPSTTTTTTTTTATATAIKTSEKRQDVVTEKKSPKKVPMKSPKSKPSASTSSTKSEPKMEVLEPTAVSTEASSSKTETKKEEDGDVAVKSGEDDLTRDIKWVKGDKTPFAAVCKTFEAIEDTSKRLVILDILTKFLLKVIDRSPEDLISIIYICINKLAPTWEGLELGIGETVLMKAIASATGRSLNKVKTDLQKHGDLGKVAQASRSNQPTMFQPKPLTVPAVFKTLREIAAISGHSSMNRKIDKIKFLLVSCRDNEAKYLIRALEGKLRIGLAEQTVLVALAHASVLSRNKKKSRSDLEQELTEATAILKQVYSELPTYEKIVPVLLENGVVKLEEKCKLTPGIPLKPMLAHPTKAISEILDRFQNIRFTCEFKYDGERAQIHRYENGKMAIFSRNQENMSEKYPDIMEHMKLAPKEHVKSFVIDSEAVAWDRKKKQILPFQVLSTRKRKDVDTANITVQVCVFAFDLLYLNGESLIRLPLERRRELLRESFNEQEGQFLLAKHMDGQSIEEIQTFLDEAVDGNCEGLMVKTLNEESSYEPSKRSRNWLKLKKDYLDGVGDSLDLVVIGAYYGKGKRTGFYGGFLLACYDPDREEYQTISKIATGLSEEDLATHTKFFKTLEIPKPKSYYSFGEGVKPDVWFDAQQVWEVKAADLSISPVYTAGRGLVDPNKGISLRFPRFIRIRDDKTPEEATTSDQVADMYKSQKINHGFGGGSGGGGVDDEEY